LGRYYSVMATMEGLLPNADVESLGYRISAKRIAINMGRASS
jgi:hypothetical protein